MRHPIQHLRFCTSTARLYAAASNVLLAFDASSGCLLSAWTAPADPHGASEPNPNKKRKVEDTASSPPPHGGKGGKTRQSLFAGTETNNAFAELLTTRDGKYVVTANSEDKAVRVFSTEGGRLEVLSTRVLPKRIVDLALANHDRTILCADKFGDVFGLPLLAAVSVPDSAPPTTPALPVTAPPAEGLVEEEGEEEEEEGEEKEELAGYTEERHAEKQKASLQAAAERRKRTEIDYNMSFEHEFLLGHVSMLLSLLAITLPADHPQAGGKDKTWVLTGDRDEHIRVTRFPQTYVVEGFCLGHTQFVRKLLAPSWDPTTLVSGGGDNYLLTWNWRERRILEKVDLVAQVRSVIGKSRPLSPVAAEDSEFKLAVAGLWEVPELCGVLVGVEGVPALFLFVFTGEGFRHRSTHLLAGNVLDVTLNTTTNPVAVYVSLDPKDSRTPLLVRYQLHASGEWAEFGDDGDDDSAIERMSKAVAEKVDLSEELVQAVRPNVLYPAENLRKEYGTKGRGGE